MIYMFFQMQRKTRRCSGERKHFFKYVTSVSSFPSFYAFPASPEPGPRPLKTEAEVEDGKEAFTNNNIFKTEEKVQEDEENEREVEDASEDYMDEQQTCLDKS